MVDERGQAALIVLVFLLFIVALIGLVSDGGQTLAQRRDLQGLADGAARAGGAALDQTALVSSGSALIDPTAARQAISQYLAAANYTGSDQIDATTTQVTVALTQSYPLTFDQFVGIPSVTLHASSLSAPIAR